MSVAAILGFVALSLAPRAGAMPFAAWFLTPQSAQTSSPPDASTTPNSSAPAAATPAKPCPATSSSTSSSTSDCKPRKAKPRKHNPAPDTPASGPSKTVVRNGSTTDPEVELSPGLSQQQISQQTKNTDQLLASADENLKAISGRQLSAAQRDTVAQIKSFMEQAKAASSNGDVQRAYNLANKANMLSADLKGH
jgi:hypothetical protein